MREPLPLIEVPAIPARVACARCSRWLSDPASIARGLGRSCFAKLRLVRVAPAPTSDVPLPTRRRSVRERMARLRRFAVRCTCR